MIQEPLTNLEQILQEPVYKLSGQAPALKRLTVKLVALEPSIVSASQAKHAPPTATSNPFTPLPETNDESDEDEDWFYSYEETPTASYYTPYTPQPEPDDYTPPVERLKISDPALPAFSPDLAYFGDGIGYQSQRRMSRDVIERAERQPQAIMLEARGISSPSLSGLLPAAPVAPAVARVRHFDLTLFCLTALLLLGILGGIGLAIY